MAVAARWIRLEANAAVALRAVYAAFAQAQPSRAMPAVLWARAVEGGFRFALVVPLRLAPGRAVRWRSWALAPLIATYRGFGLRAYLDGDCVCLSGRRIAHSEATAVGCCAVIDSGFLPRLPEARVDWTERNLVDAFRARIEAQHGWQFDSSWPSVAEQAAIADALTGEEVGAK